jgi:hypothetical protein
MQYTVRAFIEGGQDERLDEICRTFSSMERTVYNVLREGMDAGTIKAILRERYGVKNARWIQSSINQARAMMVSQEGGGSQVQDRAVRREGKEYQREDEEALKHAED